MVQKQVAAIIRDRILVGHSLDNDLKALLMSHPHSMTRDTARYPPLTTAKGKPRALRSLVREHLNIAIQTGEHDPVRSLSLSLGCLCVCALSDSTLVCSNRIHSGGRCKSSHVVVHEVQERVGDMDHAA